MKSDHDLQAAFRAEEQRMDEITRRLQLLAHDHLQRLRAQGHSTQWEPHELVETTIHRALTGRLHEYYSDEERSLFGFLALALRAIAKTGKLKGH